METLHIENIKEIKKALPDLKKRLSLKILMEGKKLTIEGAPLDEYEALNILEAISFGFSAKQAQKLIDADFTFRRTNIKKFTHRTNREIVRARIIGKEGKVKKTMETLTNSDIIIKGNEIGIICPTESINYILTALSNLIRGSKQSNIYSFLERMNAKRKALGECAYT